MPFYTVETTETADVTYVVEAATPEEAFALLKEDRHNGEIEDRSNNRITGLFEDAAITEEP